ncbi:CPX1 [Symbiodinium sp. CCMP2592]|nr:CPX1 [Symbiodinium sp. CCMP2592]
MAQQWASAVPTPKPSGGAAWRLLDVNLIIVGCGPEAVQLLQRRVDAGGRACLLWTDRPPRHLPSRLEPCEHDRLLFDPATFRWQPPALASTSCPEVRHLRRRFRSTNYGFMRAGPDIVALAEEESYELLFQGQDLVGLRVLLDDEVLWELSGAVLRVDPPLEPQHQLPLSPLAGWAETVDVHVQQEEALPQMFVDGGGLVSIAFGAAYYMLAHFSSHIVVNFYERDVQPGDVGWWWFMGRTQTAWAGHVWSHQLAHGLLGYRQPFGPAVLAFLVGFLVWTLWEMALLMLPMLGPNGWHGWRIQYFVMSSCGFEISSVSQLIVSTCASRSTRIKPYSTSRTKDTRGHILWTAFLLSLNMVLVLSQWSILVVYT